MAFNGYIRWCVVCTLPADDHKFRHVFIHDDYEDERLVKKNLRRVNPDMKVLRLIPNAEPNQVEDEAGKAVADANGQFRHLRGNDHRLTEAAVRELRGGLASGGVVLDARDPDRVAAEMATKAPEIFAASA